MFSSRIVPCGTFLVSTLTLCLPLGAQQEVESTAADAPPVLVAMASDDAPSKLSVQRGMQELLLGWEEAARSHFRAALSADSDCALAWAGLMVVDGATPEFREELARILSEDPLATPQESALLSSLMRLVQAGAGGAGEEFAERATLFRHDVLSACWAVRLLHDGYEPIGGKPLPAQQRALTLAQELYERKPGYALVAYLRGWVEESAPQPSEAALLAAQQAAEAMPEHPCAALLYGHLLYRTGRLKEALPQIQRAVRCAQTARENVPCGTNGAGDAAAASVLFWPLELRAKLYESTLLWLSGDKKGSLQVQADLLKAAHAVEPAYASAPGAVLLHWEARTLPLRLLMLQAQLPSDAQVAAATKASLPPQAGKDEPLLAVRDCLRFCLVARQRAAAKKMNQALRCVESAQASLKRLEAARDACAGQGGYVLSAWARAHEACQSALLAARAAVYPQSSEMWLQSLEQSERLPSLLMPPVLPRQK